MPVFCACPSLDSSVGTQFVLDPKDWCSKEGIATSP
jgi:hypothetical protein